MKGKWVVKELDQIIDEELPDMEKLAKAFEWLTGQTMEHHSREIEVLQALGDEEALIKERIKLGMVKAVREQFQYCYMLVQRKKAER
jgi:hypothetical protein